MSQNHFTLMCLQVQHLVLESATLSVRISNTSSRSCAALWSADLGSSRQDTFRVGTFEGFPTSRSCLKKPYQWSQLGKIDQGGITCEAIDEPRKSSKAIDKRVIINFCDKNVVIARFIF